HLVPRRSWICGALQHDELAGPQRRRDRSCRVQNVRQVRLARVSKRGGNAYDDRIHFTKSVESTGRVEAVSLHFADHFGADVADVALAPLQLLHLDRIHVEAKYRKALHRKGSGEWQADIPQANDPDFRQTIA